MEEQKFPDELFDEKMLLNLKFYEKMLHAPIKNIPTKINFKKLDEKDDLEVVSFRFSEPLETSLSTTEST